MKCVVPRDSLYSAVALAKSAAAESHTLHSIGDLALETHGSGLLSVRGNDLTTEAGMTVSVSGSNYDERIGVDAKRLASIVGAMPKKVDLLLSAKADKLTVAAVGERKLQASLPLSPNEPCSRVAEPRAGEEIHESEIDVAGSLGSALELASAFCSDTSRPHTNQVFATKDCLFATNGHGLVKIDFSLDLPMMAYIPQKAAVEAAKFLKGASKCAVEVYSNDNGLRAIKVSTLDGMPAQYVAAAVVGGDPPPFDKVIERLDDQWFEVDSAELLEAVNGAMRSCGKIVRLSSSKAGLLLSSEEAGAGYQYELSADGVPSAVDAKFAGHYLSTLAKGLPGKIQLVMPTPAPKGQVVGNAMLGVRSETYQTTAVVMQVIK